jgi:hypothetical protein
VLNLILWMLAMALGTFIVSILLGPIPTSTDPVCSRPKQAPPTLFTVGDTMPSSAEGAFCMSTDISTTSGTLRGETLAHGDRCHLPPRFSRGGRHSLARTSQS